MLNIALVFLLASVTAMVAMFAYKQYCVKESRETIRMDETEREIMKAEKEREKARIIEETGYSERDEYNDDDSDDGEE
ncbi:MAG: hypothetical protein QG646_1538 [Euryarchaeota archaeon]|nr:hypothetical protein [Euryarchaeota archaeon]